MTTKDPIAQKATEGSRETRVGACGTLSYLLMAVGTVVLAVTGLGAVIQGKTPMTHWVLMAHASAAPVFAIGLALVSLTWAEHARFGNASTRQTGLAKALFWIILASGLVVILSGVVPMTPLFGTHGQHTLYLTHRYSAMVLAVAVVLHWLSLIPKR